MNLVVLLIFCFIVRVFLFEQDDYKIVFERLEVFRYNKQYLKDVKIVNFKYNRTCAASNYSGIFKENLGNDIMVHLEAFKVASNEYRPFPIEFEFSFCSAIARNDFGMNNFYKCGHFAKCPFEKGNYTFCNFIPDQSKFPPFIPDGSYRLDLKFMNLSTELQYIPAYGTVKRPIKIPFKK